MMRCKGSSTFLMGPLLPPPPPQLRQGTIPRAPLITSVSSGQTTSGNGTIGVGHAPVGTVPPSPQFLVSEGLNIPADVRRLGLWQYEHFVKNGGHPFLAKLGAEEAFLWISLSIGVFGSMTCPMEYYAQIITRDLLA